ncbi:COPII coat Sec23p-Sfb3p heterodimer component [Blastocladiella emersonii ATCC 22665]|nr:COPII coat Sec23p-Sfb3p heterodimer component [Blastocladiella emersonii ATCC 22665]
MQPFQPQGYGQPPPPQQQGYPGAPPPPMNGMPPTQPQQPGYGAPPQPPQPTSFMQHAPSNQYPPTAAGGPPQQGPPQQHPNQNMPPHAIPAHMSHPNMAMAAGMPPPGAAPTPPPPMTGTPGPYGSASPAPPPPGASGSPAPAAAGRRRMYPDQMAQAYSATPPPLQHQGSGVQQQQQQQQQYVPQQQGMNGAPPGMPPHHQMQQQQPPNAMQQMTNQFGQMQFQQQQQQQQPGMPPQQQQGPPPPMYGQPPPPQQPGMLSQPPSFGSQSNLANSMGGGAPPAPPKSKIDPNQIPSPVAVQEQDQATYATEPYRTCSKAMPPLPSTRFRVLDEGNASPRFVRMTTYNVPCTEDLLAQSMMPLGCIVQPLAELEAGEAEIEVVQPGETGPVRCRRCRAYINPMMQFVDGGRKFTCNFCFIENETPADYFCNLDMTGRRVDIMQRPELRCGSVEFVAGKEFINKPPKPVALILAIDVSWNAIQSGLLAQMAKIVRDWLFSDGSEARIPKGAQVGILTYDRTVHFYNFHPSLDQFQMLVVPDVDDTFVPLSTGFLVDPFESRPVIESFLDALPTLFRENRAAESAFGAVAQAVVNYLEDRGGRVLMFHTSLPTFGPGTLKNREDPKLYGTDKEKALFQPQDPFYRTLSTAAVNAGVCFDLFLFPYAYMDVATIGQLATNTGGESSMYPQFHVERDGARLHTDVLRSLTRQFGYNAMMRVRTSNGLRVVDHLGNFFTKDNTDLEIAGIDADKAIAIALKHDAKLDEKQESAIQIALLYTTATGDRRIRVHNLSLTNTTLLGNVFRFAELDTTVNFLAKSACSAALTQPLATVRTQLTEKCVKVLASYRKNCASSTSPGQLILPETFKLFPLCTLALHKHRALKAGDLPSDVRVAAMRELRSLAVPLSVPLLYPRVFSLHAENDPQPVRASYERLDPAGCYLLENGQMAMLWLGRQIAPDLVQQILGVPALEAIDLRTHVLPALDTPASRRVQALLADIATRYHRHLSVQIVRQGVDQVELEFLAHMAEDKNHEAMSYVDFLVYVHRQIHAEVRNSGAAVTSAYATAMSR